MQQSSLAQSTSESSSVSTDRLELLREMVHHAAHLLPTQGPITVFIHHNTLHAFEDLKFTDAVAHAATLFDCQPYFPEARYRQEAARGRILTQDLAAALLDDLGDDADRLVGRLGTRYTLRLSMLQHPLEYAPDAELRWLIAETNALFKFRPQASTAVRDRMIDSTRRWIMRERLVPLDQADHRLQGMLQGLSDIFGSRVEQWTDATWEAVTLHLLWRICHQGAHAVKRTSAPRRPIVRHRDFLLRATGEDADVLVNDVLIRFCAAYLDQGMASWLLPNRDAGFYRSFIALYRDSRPIEQWRKPLPVELRRLDAEGISAEESILESLDALGVGHDEREDYIAQTLLALPGWAGGIWQMETNAEWTVRPAPKGSLVGYLAVRLILERLALKYLAAQSGTSDKLDAMRSSIKDRRPSRPSLDQRTFVMFQLAQSLDWRPEELFRLTREEWQSLVHEIDTFSSVERRRIYHLAFERRHRHQTLDALQIAAERATTASNANATRPHFQVICCLDEREESFRRHLEEIAPRCETFGVAGFFGVAMYYRGAADAHFKPLCPAIIKPRHYVQEEVVYTLEQAHRRRAGTRRAIGRLAHRLHLSSRSAIGGVLTSIFGSIASAPLVARVLFPRLTAQVRRRFGALVQPPPVTRLVLERTTDEPGPGPGQIGFTIDEMCGIVEMVLQDAGLTSNFGKLVVITGHGSSSLNNPHAAAYDCGACGGARGGPNARAFAAMANDHRVRERLAEKGLAIPDDTHFIGAFHNTCDDSVTYFDLNRMPSSHRQAFEEAKHAIDEARARNAHERCRRFESAELTLAPSAALRHVEARSEDLSQARPEYGHATNAVCIVGRRERNKGLFLDRRAFLTSYDPLNDGPGSPILERILRAAIPVCAGISLEYYFSAVDTTRYGCGNKLTHNVTSLLGVMEGAASDLRTGLNAQMVEIHEPIRCLFIIETTPSVMEAILARNPGMERLCKNEWVQLATIDPHSPTIHVYREGRFERYERETSDLPSATSSIEWYRGWRDNLGPALIAAGEGAGGRSEQGGRP